MPDLLPLTLGVRRVPHAKVIGPDGGRKAPPQPTKRLTAAEWPRLRERVLKRDNYTCRYCGFRAEKFQRVHFKNGEQAAPEAANLVTACIFCEQCFELESVAGMNSGMLIWLPELPQTDLHHFARALFLARRSDGALYQRAQATFDQLTARRAEAKKRLGTDDPLMLATTLAEHLDDAAYAARAARLDGIRLLPLPSRMSYAAVSNTGAQDQFPRILDYWASQQGPFGKYPVDKWPDLFAAQAA